MMRLRRSTRRVRERIEEGLTGEAHRSARRPPSSSTGRWTFEGRYDLVSCVEADEDFEADAEKLTG